MKTWREGDRCLAPIGHTGKFSPGAISWVAGNEVCVKTDSGSSIVCELSAIRPERVEDAPDGDVLVVVAHWKRDLEEFYANAPEDLKRRHPYTVMRSLLDEIERLRGDGARLFDLALARDNALREAREKVRSYGVMAYRAITDLMSPGARGR